MKRVVQSTREAILLKKLFAATAEFQKEARRFLLVEQIRLGSVGRHTGAFRLNTRSAIAKRAKRDKRSRSADSLHRTGEPTLEMFKEAQFEVRAKRVIAQWLTLRFLSEKLGSAELTDELKTGIGSEIRDSFKGIPQIWREDVDFFSVEGPQANMGSPVGMEFAIDDCALAAFDFARLPLEQKPYFLTEIRNSLRLSEMELTGGVVVEEEDIPARVTISSGEAHDEGKAAVAAKQLDGVVRPDERVAESATPPDDPSSDPGSGDSSLVRALKIARQRLDAGPRQT